MTQRTGITRILLATVLLVSVTLANAQTVIEQAAEHRYQIDFRVNDAALAKMLPTGWEKVIQTQGPAKDCNLRMIFIDRMAIMAEGGKTAAPTINMQARQKADVIMALQQSFDYGGALIKEFNDQQLLERVTPPRFMGPSASRIRIAYFSLVHTEDIYGQMVVYLRMAGVTPPASAAPSLRHT